MIYLGFGSRWHVMQIAMTDAEFTFTEAGSHPSLDQALAYVKCGDRCRLQELTQSESPDSQHELRRGVAWSIETTTFFDDWAVDQPDNPCAVIWCGAVHVIMSWRARGYGRGFEVSGENWRRAHEEAELAAGWLHGRLQSDRSDPEAASWLIRALTIMSGGKDDFDAAWACLSSAPEPHLAGRLHMLTANCQKWHGDHETAFAFARQEAWRPDAPAGYEALIACAHVERWLWDVAFERNMKLASAYRKCRSVRNELLASQARFDERYNPEDVLMNRLAHNWMAFAMLMIGEKEHARAHLRGLGVFALTHPWGFLGDVENVVTNAWQKVSLGRVLINS